MHAITIREPWATAIVHLGKDVENRSVAAMWRCLVGETVAIHAAARLDQDGMCDPVVRRAWFSRGVLGQRLADHLSPGAIIGVVHVTDLHWADDCGGCSPWAQGPWIGERRICHLALTNPRPLAAPIPARGHLGPWHLPLDIAEQVRADLASAGVSA